MKEDLQKAAEEAKKAEDAKKAEEARLAAAQKEKEAADQAAKQKADATAQLAAQIAELTRQMEILKGGGTPASAVKSATPSPVPARTTTARRVTSPCARMRGSSMIWSAPSCA